MPSMHGMSKVKVRIMNTRNADETEEQKVRRMEAWGFFVGAINAAIRNGIDPRNGLEFGSSEIGGIFTVTFTEHK